MLKIAVDFASLLLAALVGGAIFGVWLTLNPAGLNAATYVTQQQQAIRTLNVAMPLLGALTIILTLTAAGFAFDDRPRFMLLLAGAACYAAVGVITRFLNQPINASVIAWSPAAPPENWTSLPDAWWRLHQLRTALGIAGLGALAAAALVR